LTTDSESHHDQSHHFGRFRFQGRFNSKKIEFQNFALQNFPVLSNKASQHISHSSLAESRKEIPFTETTS
jgi:hypothetical protein